MIFFLRGRVCGDGGKAIWAAAIAFGVSAMIPASAQATPKIGPMESYRNWIIGCDNAASCTAASLFPEDASLPDAALTLYISRDAGPATTPRIEIILPDDTGGRADLFVDGVRIGGGDIIDSTLTLSDAASQQAIRAMLKGVTLTASTITPSKKNKTVGSASLSGLSAALRYMDAHQGRAGTVTALVAKGKLLATAVRAAPPLPVIHYISAPKGASQPAALWREEMARARTVSGCSQEDGGELEVQIAQLSEKEELVLMPCGTGAYNFSSVPLIATGAAGRRTFTLARFDSTPSWGEEGSSTPMLVNAGWDPEASTLNSYAKGRGIGDCGTAEEYVWDGSQFRLTEMLSMNTCRGAWQWITLWRAQPVLMPDKKHK